MGQSMQGCHAVAMGLKVQPVKVSKGKSNLDKSIQTTHLSLYVVEGAWAVWGSWDTCSATCGAGSRSRERNFSGGMPCAAGANEIESCQGEFMMS